MNNKKILECAYEILFKKKKPIDLYKLYEEVLKKLGLNSEQGNAFFVSFYTEISVDGRFVCIGDNKWTISEYMSSNKINDGLNDDDDDDERDPDELAQEDLDEYASDYDDKSNNSSELDLSDADDSNNIDFDDNDSF